MLISGQNNLSQLRSCLQAAPISCLRPVKRKQIFDAQIEAINDHWHSVCEEAELNETDKRLLWRRQFLNPFSLEM